MTRLCCQRCETNKDPKNPTWAHQFADMDFSVEPIAHRAGHENIDITYRYTHVFSSMQMHVVSQLNNMMISSDIRKEHENDFDQS